MKNFNIIVAIDNKGGIGKNGNLLWHISEDLRYFKKITNGCTVIMGRKTWESLPFKPLKNRRNIIMTNNFEYNTNTKAEVIHSLNEVFSKINDTETVFCIGGGKIYEQFLPYCDTIYITKVFADFEADTFFPNISEQHFSLIEKSPVYIDDNTNLKYQFCIYKR
ncbi:MAG: dihydrofolate reductase [Bacteroidales bacterium]|jgi:dihydrofolate reductase|nr:dihydrofolate reductase [Bacteroidales bacterium]